MLNGRDANSTLTASGEIEKKEMSAAECCAADLSPGRDLPKRNLHVTPQRSSGAEFKRPADDCGREPDSRSERRNPKLVLSVAECRFNKMSPDTVSLSGSYTSNGRRQHEQKHKQTQHADSTCRRDAARTRLTPRPAKPDTRYGSNGRSV